MRWAVASALLLCCLGPLASAETADRKERPQLELTVETPKAGAVVGDTAGMAFLSGRALAHFGTYQTFDILFVIDTSDSTAAPSGADIDGDGEVGHKRGERWLSVLGQILPLPNSDRGDSILAAEIAAVRTLLSGLDPRTTRVGVVTFAGDTDPLQPDAVTHVPLTSDFEKVERGLEQILANGPSGFTNMMSGVRLATVELLGTKSAYSEPRPEARRIMIFLTDGTPTLPLQNSHNENARMAISQAVKAGKARIRIDTYAIGDLALSEPVVAVEMARVSSGVFTPVRDPRNLEAVFEEVSFADIDRLEIKNLTTKADAEYQIQNADGSFSALLPVADGRNTLEVYARSTDGTEARRQVEVRVLAGEEAEPLDPRLVAQRNRLMENRLQDLQRQRLAIEAERNERIRRELQIEIEAERSKAEEAAARARKDLEIEVEPARR